MDSGAQGKGWHPVTPSEVSVQETLERERGLRDSPWAQTPPDTWPLCFLVQAREILPSQWQSCQVREAYLRIVEPR